MLDPAEVGARLRQRRRETGLSLRRAADEAGVSFTTLSRVEGGHVPDLTTYRKLMRWLGMDDEGGDGRASTPQVIAGHLQRDPSLTTEDADRIALVVGELYQALARRNSPVPVHLRAATTLQPQVARMLGVLVNDMYERLSREA